MAARTARQAGEGGRWAGGTKLARCYGGSGISSGKLNPITSSPSVLFASVSPFLSPCLTHHCLAHSSHRLPRPYLVLISPLSVSLLLFLFIWLHHFSLCVSLSSFFVWLSSYTRQFSIPCLLYFSSFFLFLFSGIILVRFHASVLSTSCIKVTVNLPEFTASSYILVLL